MSDRVARKAAEDGGAVVDELGQEKLPQLIELKYHTMEDAVALLGDISTIRDVFVGFQEHLYAPAMPS